MICSLCGHTKDVLIDDEICVECFEMLPHELEEICCFDSPATPVYELSEFPEE
jgi:hypothetical protein